MAKFAVYDPDTGDVVNVIVAESQEIAERVTGKKAAHTDRKPGSPDFGMRFDKQGGRWDKVPPAVDPGPPVDPAPEGQ